MLVVAHVHVAHILIYTPDEVKHHRLSENIDFCKASMAIFSLFSSMSSALMTNKCPTPLSMDNSHERISTHSSSVMRFEHLNLGRITHEYVGTEA
jgi:hypothetical protein